jgi:hypothetical protein
MNSLTFDDIWPQFSWVIDELREEGMCFIEGYIPLIGQTDLLTPISELIGRSKCFDFSYSVWSENTTETERERDYSSAEYTELFRSNQVVTLHFDYEYETDHIVLNQKLMIEKNDSEISLEIICYREAILQSDDSKEAVETALSEFRYLKHLFDGDALLIGPDTLDYPVSGTEFPKEWLRIE